jgi:hypothetical protein
MDYNLDLEKSRRKKPNSRKESKIVKFQKLVEKCIKCGKYRVYKFTVGKY